MPRIHPVRVVLFLILGLMIGAWSYAQWDSYRMRQSLSVVRDATVLEYRRHSDRLDDDRLEFEVIGEVTAAREFGVFGDGIGKITLYTRETAPPVDFGGVEFFYVYDEMNEEWDLQDSVAFRDLDSRKKSEAAFERAGI